MTENNVLIWLTEIGLGDGPAVLFLSIILLSYLLEDLAIVTAAVLAADGSMGVGLALSAVFVGIATGDLGLYYLAAWSARWRSFRYKLLTNRSMRYVRSRLKNNTTTNIFIIRFIPGLRTLGYSLCGLFSIDVWRFMAAVLLATGLWTGLIFGLVYQVGSSEWLQSSEYKWWLVPIAVVLLFSTNRIAKQKVIKGRVK